VLFRSSGCRIDATLYHQEDEAIAIEEGVVEKATEETVTTAS